MKNKKIIEKVKKQNGGITLIALVITIIVLLILAGVTITTLTGDNGLLGKTSESKFITEIQHYNEELKLSITEDYTNSMGNRQNKFNVRRNSYNEENSFIDAMKSKIPSFDNKYANKLEIKEDKLNYIGDNEQERAWLTQVISVAGILKISYVLEDGTEAFPTYEKVITDESYEVESPKKEGYEPDQYIVSGEINGDTNIIVTYYSPSQNLSYELLSDGTYTVSGIGTFTGDTLVIPDKYNDTSVTKIKQEAFKNNNTIKKLIIPNTIKVVESKAFSGCSNLEYANLDAEVFNSSYTFSASGKLKKICIGEHVKQLASVMFYLCNNLTDVIIHTEQADIRAEQFREIAKLKEVKVNENNKKYKVVNGVLYSKDLKKIYMYPPGKEGETYIFSPEIEEIGNHAFYGNKYLTRIEIPSTVSVSRSNAFSLCNNIEYMNINTNQLNTYTIVSNRLKKVDIGTNVKYIDYCAFFSCNKIEECNYLGTVEQWNNISKHSGWYKNSSITQVKCIDGTINV